MQISFAKDLNEQNNSSLSFWLIFLLLSVVYSLVMYYHKKNVVVYTRYLSTAKICAMIRLISKLKTPFNTQQLAFWGKYSVIRMSTLI